MIKAQHIPWAEKIFEMYINRLIRKHFYTLHLIGNLPSLVENKPVLLLPNHRTWWDGFFIYTFIHHFYKRPLYIMMLEEELKKYKFFAKLGAYSIQPGQPKSVLKSLQYSISLLKNKQHPAPFVCIFPEGELFSWGKRQPNFKKGIEWIIRKSDEPIIILILSIYTTFVDQQLPQVFFQLSRPEEVDTSNFQGLTYLEDLMAKTTSHLTAQVEKKENGIIFLRGTKSVNQRWNLFRNQFIIKK